MSAKKLLFISGSTRVGSFNSALAKTAYEFALSQNVNAELIDLSNYPLPLFNEDDESKTGMPEAAKKLKQKFSESDGYFIATPEYNGSFTPLLKNTLDWISRAHLDNETPLSAYRNKAAAIGGASPGGFGAMRALVPLRLLLSNLGVNTVGSQLALSGAHEAFDESGQLKSNHHQSMLQNIINSLIKIS